MEFCDAFVFYKKSKDREEAKAKADLRKLQLVAAAIHASDPQEFIEEIENVIQGNELSDEVGDLGKLEKLGATRRKYRRAGD